MVAKHVGALGHGEAAVLDEGLGGVQKKGLTSKEKTEMLDQIKDVDGVKWALGMDSFVGAAFPDTMIPSNLKKMICAALVFFMTPGLAFFYGGRNALLMIKGCYPQQR